MQHGRTFDLGHPEPITGAEHGEVEYAITRRQWLTARDAAEHLGAPKA